MVNTLPKPEAKNNETVVKTSIEENLLTPRFYITDFEAVANMDISSQETQIRAMVEEMKTDYNRDHFVRNEEFKKSWDHLDEETRAAFTDFLERSTMSEFSGFILFKELSRRIKDRNPLLSEVFHLMARDEARHAGFLNKAMGDFKVTLNLPYLTKNRTYTFFKPEWILYGVYLSEKIGYWRYITMYRHLEKHPENKYYPIFNMFESWCQDENRHGDIFTALLRSQPQCWQDWKARLWSRFFLLTVFATHTLTVQERADFYESVGLDPTEYDREVVTKTNETAGRAFPVMLDLDHPQYWERMDRCSDYNMKMKAIYHSDAPGIVKFFKSLPLKAGIFWNLLRLFLVKPIDAEALRGTVR